MRVTQDPSSALTIKLFHDRAVIGAIAGSELLLQAEFAFSAGNVEGCNNAVTGLDLRHRRSNFLNDAHAFVAQDLTGFKLHDLTMIQMQIRSADLRKQKRYSSLI